MRILLLAAVRFLNALLWYELAAGPIRLECFNVTLYDSFGAPGSLLCLPQVLVAVSAPSLLGDATPPAVYLSLPFCLAGMLMVAQVGSGLRQCRCRCAGQASQCNVWLLSLQAAVCGELPRVLMPDSTLHPLREAHLAVWLRGWTHQPAGRGGGRTAGKRRSALCCLLCWVKPVNGAEPVYLCQISDTQSKMWRCLLHHRLCSPPDPNSPSGR